MAIFSKLILGFAILSSVSWAAPFDGKFKAKWTVTETDYTTVDVTTTIYIDDTKTVYGVFDTLVPQSTSTSAVETSSPSAAYTAPAVPVAPSTTTSTMTTLAASPAVFYTPSSSTTPLATTPAVTTTTSSTTTTTSAAASTSAAALAKDAGTGAPSSASDTATCQGEGAACVGDITYYGGGLGACGYNVDPNGNGVALPYEFMGTESNDNPYCGKTLTIYNPATGETAQGTVMDKCMGCVGRSIDLVPALFEALSDDDLPEGRIHNVDWWFN